MRVSPSTALAATALFFALGGSAIAVNEAVKPQARCQPGAVRGYVAVNGDPTKGMWQRKRSLRPLFAKLGLDAPG